MNDQRLEAVSISQAIRAQCVPGFQARVLHAFPRALDLLVSDQGPTAGTTVVALVDVTVGDGPFNVVVSALAPFAGVSAGAVVQGDGRCLRVDRLVVDLAGARIWDPRWAWERRVVRCQISDVSSQKAVVRWPEWPSGLYESAAQSARRAAVKLEAALRAGDRRGLTDAAATLAGLGPGLTPGGDDFLAGVMWGLRFRCAWPGACDVDALCDAIVEAAAPRTTPLSAALLRAAGIGLADARWHALFDVLDRGADVAAAIQDVLAQGATSGADAWAGFRFVAGLAGCAAVPIESGQGFVC